LRAGPDKRGRRRQAVKSPRRETRDIISRELFGHYDLTNLAVLTSRTFPNVFEPGNAMCRGWLYLHVASRLDMCFKES